ncbi:hypothetical protein KGK29_004562 [Salmonella enterica]|nr:hypothetical protein [Salmonella enterica]
MRYSKEQMSDADSEEFLPVSNFSSMSLETGDYHCEPEVANEMMILESKNFFKNIFEQLKKGKTCNIALQQIYSEYLVVDLQDRRSSSYYLPDDTDLHYPVQNIEDAESIENDLLKRALKYREGVYVWLMDGAD